tara:strand:+ start:30617 stop:31162 length:546 start_codon:yes stop_codon:yes gene_type:complete
MTTKIFQDLKEELQLGITEKNHPFRYFTLGTVGLDKMARLRTVVLRNVSDTLNLSFYTDKRSKKVIHITENNKVSLLFFHPQKMIQIKIEGIATIIKDKKTVEDYWNTIQENSQKEYTTTAAPGSSIANYEAVEYLGEDNYFCVVTIAPHKIEYLKLERPNHIRIRYSKDYENWKGEYLVP